MAIPTAGGLLVAVGLAVVRLRKARRGRGGLKLDFRAAKREGRKNTDLSAS